MPEHFSEVIRNFGTLNDTIEFEGGKSINYKSCSKNGGWCCFQDFIFDSKDIVVDYLERGRCSS